MRLGFRVLDSSSSLNNLQYLNQRIIVPGETTDIFVQLVDLNTVTDKSQWGTRVMPATGATLNATINSVNDAFTLSKVMTQPFAQDPSIWKFSLLATETQNMAGINMDLILTEGSNVSIARGFNVIIMSPQSPYGC